MQVSGNHDDGRPFITAMFTYAGGVGARATKPGPVGVLVPDRRRRGARSRWSRRRRRSASCARSCGPAAAAPARRSAASARRSSSPSTPTRPWQLNAVTSRLSDAPQGIFGGEAGAAGSFTVNGEPVRTQSRITLQPGDHVRLDLPGGGGYGDAPTEAVKVPHDRH